MLLKKICNIRFRRKTEKSFEMAYPSEYETRHLAINIRYHMSQVLACLVELKIRDVEVCSLLSNELAEYKECAIKYNENQLKMFVRLEGRKVCK